MYLFLAFFWIAVAVVVQIFWDTLEKRAYVPVGRSAVGFVCFVLFSYNFIRWRVSRARAQAQADLEPPPKPRRANQEYDPTFDFSEPKPKDGDEKKPGV